MNRRSVLAAGLAAPLLGCGDPIATIDYCYRFKVVVQIGGREHVGDSVIRVRWRDRSGEALNLDGRHFRISVWAEPPIVDMGPRRGLLFALLRKREHDLRYPVHIFPRFAVGMGERRSAERVSALQELTLLRQELYVPREEWPMFVRFSDLNDPASVEEITPRNIASVYGAGVSIERLTMQITNEEPTHRIASVLPWLRGLETNLAGERQIFVEGPIARRLGGSDFQLWNVSS